MTSTKQRNFNFSSASNKPLVSPILTRTVADAPTVWYAPKVWDQMWYIVAQCEKEVGWLGLVEEVEGGFVIPEIFVPEQHVTGAETDISPDAMVDLAMRLADEGKDPSKLRYWAHSHVNMGVTPSGQDEEQVDEYLEHAQLFIRGIYNKRGDAKVDVYDVNEGVVFQCVENDVYTPGLSREDADALDAIIDQNVKTRSYAAPAYSYHGREGTWVNGRWVPRENQAHGGTGLSRGSERVVQLPAAQTENTAAGKDGPDDGDDTIYVPSGWDDTLTPRSGFGAVDDDELHALNCLTDDELEDQGYTMLEIAYLRTAADPFYFQE